MPSVVWEILELGRFPRRKNNPANDTEIREDNLAKTLYKQKNKIPEEWWEKVQQLKEKRAEDGAAAAKAQLEQLKENNEQAEAEARAEAKASANALRASELMREVRQLGHYPDQRVRSEVPLYQRLKRARSEMLFQRADEAELQEMDWTAQRQKREAALERAASVVEEPAVLEVDPGECSVPSFGEPM